MAKKYNNNNRGKSRKWKNIVKIVVASICSFAIGIGVAALTAPKDLNEKNLLKYENYVNKLEESAGGLKIDWKEDGRIVLSGKHASDDTTNNSKFTSPFVSVALTEGTYQISSGNKHASSNTYGLYYVLNGEYHEVCKNVDMFTVAGATVIEIGFFVKNNEFILHAKFKPVLVAKGDSTEFFKD